MFSAILLACSLEKNVCMTMAHPGYFNDMGTCLENLASGFTAAEQTGWTIINYTCLDWETKEFKINPDKS